MDKTLVAFAVSKDRMLKKTALAAMAATSIEYFDFFLFASAAATVFPKVFFSPDTSPLVATIESFAAFAIGFLARPAGAILFGHFGDVVGRKMMLVIAMLMMGLSTALIGVLPSHAVIGDAAPLLLVILRLLQGIALGGQWGGAVLMILENAPSDKKGWYCAFAQIGPPVGIIVANLTFLAVSGFFGEQAFADWAWRLPFVSSLALLGIGYYVHTHISDTAAFTADDERAGSVAPAPRRAPMIEALTASPVRILLAAGVYIGMQASYYVLVSFAITYGTLVKGSALSIDTMLMAVMIGAAVMIPGVFLGSSLSDKVGRAAVIGWGAAATALWSFAIFPLLNGGTPAAAIAAIGVGQFLNGIVFGPIAPLYGELFAVRVRYSAMSLAYQIGSLAGGAFAPLIATTLLHEFGSAWPIAIYLASMSAASTVCAVCLRWTKPADLTSTG